MMRTISLKKLLNCHKLKLRQRDHLYNLRIRMLKAVMDSIVMPDNKFSLEIMLILINLRLLRASLRKS